MPEHGRRGLPVVGAEEERLSRRDPERLELVLREELGDRRADLSGLLVADEVREPLRPALLRDVLESSQLGARVRARDAQEPDGFGVCEDAELGPARELGRVLELESEACIRLVRSEPPVGLLVRHLRERRLDLDPEALAPDGREGPLDQREQHLPVRERHLDVELRDLLHAVGAEVLVPEADRDLVVAVEARDHRQLLEDLWALRQREEAALVQPARHDEVPRSLGCRLEEDRSLDVEETGLLHLASDDPDHLCAQSKVALELAAAAGRASGSGGEASRRRPPRRAGTAAASSATRSRARRPGARPRRSASPRSRSPGRARRPRRAHGARTRCGSPWHARRLPASARD